MIYSVIYTLTAATEYRPNIDYMITDSRHSLTASHSGCYKNNVVPYRCAAAVCLQCNVRPRELEWYCRTERCADWGGIGRGSERVDVTHIVRETECQVLLSVHKWRSGDDCRWWLYVMIVCDKCMWWLGDYCMWLLYVMTICDYCMWWLYVMIVCDYCMWLLYVMIICDDCMWWLYVMIVCDD